MRDSILKATRMMQCRWFSFDYHRNFDCFPSSHSLQPLLNTTNHVRPFSPSISPCPLCSTSLNFRSSFRESRYDFRYRNDWRISRCCHYRGKEQSLPCIHGDRCSLNRVSFFVSSGVAGGESEQ